MTDYANAYARKHLYADATAMYEKLLTSAQQSNDKLSAAIDLKVHTSILNALAVIDKENAKAK